MRNLPYSSVTPSYASLCSDDGALLLLFTSTWHATQQELSAIREQLAALNTALLVVSEHGAAHYMNPRQGEPESPVIGAAELAALRLVHGPERGRGFALTLVELDGREVFRLADGQRDDLASALLEALLIARQSVTLPARSADYSQRELVLFSLVGALNWSLSDAAAPLAV